MSSHILLVFILTFVIHLISTLSYSVQMVAVKTGRIAISFALFNILALVSRTSNSFQAPLLAKNIEQNILTGSHANVESEFRWLLISATLATIVGSFLIPTFQRLFSKVVLKFSATRSIPSLVLHAFSKSGIKHLRDNIKAPSVHNISGLKEIHKAPLTVLLLNILVVAFLTTGVFSSLYAGYLDPSLRATSSNLSAVVNGIATILMFVVVDPYLSAMTDDVAEGKVSEAFFRQCVVLLVVTRLIGTLLAQLLLVPGAHLIVAAARMI